MKWLKDLIVDLIVTIFIIAAIFLGTTWMRWIIIGYTGIMLIAKIIVLMADSSLQLIRKTKTDAPEWFTHLLYAINTGVLIYGTWWYTAGGWLLIWILSYLAQRKLQASRGAA